MERKKLTEPDYDFVLEHMDGKDVEHKIFFESDMLILKATAGEATILINAEEHQFKSGTNFLLLDGIMLKVVTCSTDFSIEILRFSPNFMNEIYSQIDSKVFDVIAFSAPDLYDEKAMDITGLIFQQLCTLHMNKTHAFKDKMAVNCILNFIYEIYEQTHIYKEHRTKVAKNRKEYFMDNFYTLCLEKHSEHRNIEYYAENLHITPRYLYKICKESIQMTPKECIDYITSGSAKRMLLTTNLTTQQIALELNFPDQATFGQYFKRNVGMSPSEFRNRYK